jgi:electron transfer flavoprotein alpha subunit
LAGISPQTRIVAINTDAKADIFKVANVGVVADWQHLLPELLRRVEAQARV